LNDLRRPPCGTDIEAHKASTLKKTKTVNMPNEQHITDMLERRSRAYMLILEAHDALTK